MTWYYRQNWSISYCQKMKCLTWGRLFCLGVSFEKRVQLMDYLLHPNRSSKVIRPVLNEATTINITIDMTLSNVIDMVSYIDNFSCINPSIILVTAGIIVANMKWVFIYKVWIKLLKYCCKFELLIVKL